MSTADRLRLEGHGQGLQQGLSLARALRHALEQPLDQAITLLRQLERSFGQVPVELADRLVKARKADRGTSIDGELDPHGPRRRVYCSIMSIAERIRLEGYSEGLSQGLQQGLSQGPHLVQNLGQVNALLRLLQKRFGAIHVSLAERVKWARKVDLDAWTDRVLDAKNLAEVFAS